jgi:hypothetical protein
MKSMKKKLMAAAVAVAAMSAGARAAMIELPAVQDATLFGGSDATNNASGSVPGMFVGTDGQGNAKRGLIEFDIADNIPAGSTITAVSLTMTVGQVAGSGGGGGSGSGGSYTISLFNESQAWSPSTNVAGSGSFGGTGHGAAAHTGDVTWNDAAYPSTAWNVAAGGNWTTSLTDLADASVGATSGASYTWSSQGLVASVQSWLDTPSTNFGWLIKNADETDATDFRAFWGPQGAANAGNAALAPELTVTYTPLPEPVSVLLIGIGAAGLLGRRRSMNVRRP